MSDKYAALRAAAEKATPGPWEYYHGNTSIEYNVDSMEEDQGSVLYVNSGDFTQKQTNSNGEFIAAANPATILSLLAEREADKARIAELESRKVKLPSLNPQMFNDDVIFGYRKAQKEAVDFCAAAGITLETGE